MGPFNRAGGIALAGMLVLGNALAAVAPDGGTVDHRSFDLNDPTVYKLRRFNGKYTCMQISQTTLDRVGIARVRKAVDEQDIIYAAYKAYLQRDPLTTDGLTTVSVYENSSCGAACCENGGTGNIEVRSDFFDWPDYEHYIIHEFAHAFDFHTGKVFVESEVPLGHAWTSFWQFWIEYSLRLGEQGLNAPDLMRYNVRKMLEPYEAMPGANWQQCIADENCPYAWMSDSVMKESAQGGMVLRVAQLFGDGVMRKWIPSLNAIMTERNNVLPSTPQDRSELLIESLSRAAQTDLSCFFDAWHFPMGTALRGRLAAYGVNPYCQDADGDGYSRFRYDCNDQSASIHPGAPEIANGVDDNCDGLKDESVVKESVTPFPPDQSNPLPVTLPVHIEGSAPTSTDYPADCFTFNMAAADSLQVTMKSKTTFQGWVQFRHAHDPSDYTITFNWSGDIWSQKVNLPAGAWDFCVTEEGSFTADHGGPYELTIQKAYPFPTAADLQPITFTPKAATVARTDKYNLPLPAIPASVAGLPSLTAHFWMSGFGDVGSIAANSATPFVWTAPAGTNPLAPTYRINYYSAGVPVHPFSQQQSLLGPQAWKAADIGTLNVGLSERVGEQNHSIRAYGADIWSTADGFRFTYLPLNGNGEVVARVLTLDGTRPATKAGVMIRETLASNSKNAFMGIMSGPQADFQTRTTTGGTTTNTKRAQAAPAWVKLTRNGDVIAGYTSPDGSTWTALGAPVTVPMAANLFAGLAVTSHDNSLQTTAGFGNVSVVSYATLPQPWLAKDIGTVGVAGSNTHNAGIFTVQGSGADIWNGADAFRFVYFPVTGDVQVTARVNSVQASNAWAKAGVMIREDLTAGSRNAFMAATPSNGLTFQNRATAGGASASVKTAGAAPKWLRVARVGSTLTGSVSDNGTTWTTVGTATISMASTVYVGLAATAHDNALLGSAAFQNVSVK